jgi:cyanophycin synthetase
MRIVTSQVYVGPSVVARQPVICQRLDLGALAEWPTARLGAAFVDGLLDLLPGLAGHPGAPSGEQSLKTLMGAAPGLPLSLVYVRMAVELQRLADLEIELGHELPSADARFRDVAYGYVDASVGLAAGEAALALLLALLPAELSPAPAAPGPASDVAPRERRDHFVRIALNRSLDQTTRALVKAAEARDIPWFRIHSLARYVQLGQGRHQERLHETVTTHTKAISSAIARDKVTTSRLLAQLGLPVARQAPVSTKEEAVAAARRIGYPVVVKPAAGGKGVGIAIDLRNADQVRAAFGPASRARPTVIVEQYIEGDDHRMLVIDGELIAVARRVPGAVTGDGKQSVEQLVAEVNRDPRRGEDFTKLLNRLELDAQADTMLGERGYRRDSVPPPGEVVYLRRTANISTGGTPVDVSDAVHPDNRRMAVRAARVTGLDVIGIDFITPDIGRSYREVGGAICEVNQSPGLRPHLAVDGEPRDVVGPVIDMLYPPGRPSRVPIAAITGTNGKTTTARMVTAILGAAGPTVGMANSEGVYIDGEQVVAGDLAGSPGAQVVLRDPTVEAAVIECARRGILRRGVGFDWCNVGAVTNVADDHIGADGIATIEQLARVKRLIVELARDVAVLNADDRLCLEMASHVSAGALCFVASSPDNPHVAAHLGDGGRAVTLEGAGEEAMIVLREGASATPLVAARKLPATLDGRARHNVENAMFAAAIAHGLGAPVEAIVGGLTSFEPSFELSTGRLNVYDGHPFRVLVDHAHNPPAMTAMRQVIEDLEVEGRRLVVFSAEGNRPDRQIAAHAKAAAGTFDLYICTCRDELRGRGPSEVPDLLQRALLDAGVPEAQIRVIPEQAEAIRAALEAARPGDLVTLLNTDHERAWDLVKAHEY